MFTITANERKALIIIGCIIIFGSILKFSRVKSQLIGYGNEYSKSRDVLSQNNPEAPLSIININEAGVEQLISLPGIGPAIANRIVEYRQDNGRFKDLDQLTDVKGIGEKKLVKIKQKIKL